MTCPIKPSQSHLDSNVTKITFEFERYDGELMCHNTPAQKMHDSKSVTSIRHSESSFTTYTNNSVTNREEMRGKEGSL